jgi:hypothetical protein
MLDLNADPPIDWDEIGEWEGPAHQLQFDMVWSEDLDGDPPNDEGNICSSTEMLMLHCDPWLLVFFSVYGSDHEDGIGHCPDPGVEGGSAVEDVNPSPADGEHADGGPVDGGVSLGYLQSKLALISSVVERRTVAYVDQMNMQVGCFCRRPLFIGF